MKKKDSNYLMNWVLDQNTIKDKNDELRYAINAFSEFMVATDLEYKYNKTYLQSFVPDFLEGKDKMKNKYCILTKLVEKIKVELIQDNLPDKNWRINIDDTWIYDVGRISLNGKINLRTIQSNKMQYYFEYLGEKGFAVANEIDITDIKGTELLDQDINRFIEKIKEVSNETK